MPSSRRERSSERDAATVMPWGAHRSPAPRRSALASPLGKLSRPMAVTDRVPAPRRRTLRYGLQQNRSASSGGVRGACPTHKGIIAAPKAELCVGRDALIAPESAAAILVVFRNDAILSRYSTANGCAIAIGPYASVGARAAGGKSFCPSVIRFNSGWGWWFVDGRYGRSWSGFRWQSLFRNRPLRRGRRWCRG